MAFKLLNRNKDARITQARADNKLIKVKGKGGIIQAKQARRIQKINPTTGVITTSPIIDVDNEDDDDDDNNVPPGVPHKDKSDNTLWYLGGGALLVFLLTRK